MADAVKRRASVDPATLFCSPDNLPMGPGQEHSSFEATVASELDLVLVSQLRLRLRRRLTLDTFFILDF